MPVLRRLLGAIVALSLSAQEDPEALRQRLALLYQAKNWVALADAFDGLTPQQRGRYIGAWIEALEKSGRWERLLAVCDGILPQLEGKPSPLSKDLRGRKAKALSKLGRHSEAARVYESLGDSGDSFCYVIGTDEARLDQDWTAMEDLATKLLAKNPKDPIALSVMGEALAREERFAEALPVLRLTVELSPKDSMSWSNLGRCLNEEKAWTEAVEACNRAILLDPKLLEPRYNRGRAFFELKRYEESRDDFQAALGLKPEDPVLKENLRQAERYLKVSPHR